MTTPSAPPGAGATNERIGISYQPIAGLTLDPKNPRAHSPRQVGRIARSIKTFGFNVPILVDANLKVIAGHGRLLACKKLGWRDVPTIRLDHMSEAQARAYMIADNRLTETSTWDDALLAQQLSELSVLDLDFNLEDIGFPPVIRSYRYCRANVLFQTATGHLF
jgi:ParB-like chromosome segregation protein Spo0J